MAESQLVVELHQYMFQKRADNQFRKSLGWGYFRTNHI
jgi:hypothetical protein